VRVVQLMLFGKKKEVNANIVTEQTCTKCGDVTRRQFMEGDFVYKKIHETCGKCSSQSLMVTGVYGEYPAEKNKDNFP
jgi:hypothetical protein